MKSVVLGLVVVGLMLVSMDAGAYTSHNWRAWATTAGYVDGKVAGPMDCCVGPMPCCNGGGLIPTVLSIPCMVVNSLLGGMSAILCCGPQWSPVPWGAGACGCCQ